MRKVIFLNEKEIERLNDFYDMMSDFAEILGFEEIDEVGDDMVSLAIDVGERVDPKNWNLGRFQICVDKNKI